MVCIGSWSVELDADHQYWMHRQTRGLEALVCLDFLLRLILKCRQGYKNSALLTHHCMLSKDTMATFFSFLLPSLISKV
jgi:hypothetical protein